MRYCFVNIILLFCLISTAQETINKKQLNVFRSVEKIIVDGDLNETGWVQSATANDFFSYDPINGGPSNRKTEVKVLYDDEAIYIGAILYDAEPNKLLKEYTRRDASNANADAFWIFVNPNADGQNYYQFSVTSVNVQTDIRVSPIGNDYNWNAVWSSETKITEKGWTVEMKIPYSAIRFPNRPDQTWDINFWRLVRRTREVSSWNFVNKKLGNPGAQMGSITGINNIKSPLRLSLFPYVSAFTQHNQNRNKISYFLNGGMDVKYGINESFTLDMTLIPDFGQTKSDDKVLNLTPYETKYGENRQFFTEGTDLFNKAGLFYSRRIGDVPHGYFAMDTISRSKSRIIKNPIESKLINATKVSGRNKNNLGLGFFNAITDNTYATIEDSSGNRRNLLTEPFTNYNIIVADQAFRKNSLISIINTNKFQPSTNYFANVTGTSFRIYDKKNLFALYGNSSVSIKKQNNTSKNNIGNLYNVNIGKLNGSLIYSYGVNVVTDTYDPNDIGYLARNNEFTHNLSGSYRIFEPFWKMNYWSLNMQYYYRELFKPRSYSQTAMYIETDGTFSNYFSVGIGALIGLDKIHDYYEPRLAGRYYEMPAYHSFNSWFSTDYRKPVAFDWTIDGFTSKNKNKSISWSFSPRIRASDHFLFVYAISSTINQKESGYVTMINADSIVFGNRNIRSFTNTINGTYVFNNKSYLSLGFRHYWTTVDYFEFYLLNQNGKLDEYTNFYGNHDVSYNTFTIDMVYSWNFAPGSFINIMWKNNITKNVNITNKHFDDFFLNFDRTVNFPQVNSLSVKLSYYMDYQSLKRKK